MALFGGADVGGAGDPFFKASNVNVTVRVDGSSPTAGQFVGQSQRTSTLSIPYLDNTADGFNENVAANYATTDVVGRAEQFKTFIGANNREIPLQFRFWCESGDFGPDVMEPVRWLESLTHPVNANDGLSYPPPPVILQIGSLLVARCNVTDVNTRWGPPFEPGSMLPHGAECTVTFVVVRSVSNNGGGGTGQFSYNRFIQFPGQGSF